MSSGIPHLDGIDHIHVFVSDRPAAERWYAEVLGLSPVGALVSWARDDGPLTVANETGSVHLALFERGAQPCRSTVAFAVTASAFIAWHAHLRRTIGEAVALEDHQMSWSMYFRDPDGNPFEITCYEHAAIGSRIDTFAGRDGAGP